MVFKSDIFHPNGKIIDKYMYQLQHTDEQLVYPSGEVCISSTFAPPLPLSAAYFTNVTEVLHPPEEDKYGYESAAERWSPVQTPETILLSVISMLSSPNDESPANVEAARLWREDTREFKKRCRANVRASLGEE